MPLRPAQNFMLRLMTVMQIAGDKQVTCARTRQLKNQSVFFLFQRITASGERPGHPKPTASKRQSRAGFGRKVSGHRRPGGLGTDQPAVSSHPGNTPVFPVGLCLQRLHFYYGGREMRGYCAECGFRNACPLFRFRAGRVSSMGT